MGTATNTTNWQGRYPGYKYKKIKHKVRSSETHSGRDSVLICYSYTENPAGDSEVIL